MKQSQRSGFAIILALTAVALVGMALVVLTATSNSLMFEANLSYLKACDRNLSASALAWASQNQEKLGKSQLSQPRQLDVEQLGIPAGHLNVTPSKARGEDLKVQVDTQCSRGKMKLKRTRNYLITRR